MAFNRAAGDVVHALQGKARLLEAHRKAGNLCDRAESAAGEDDAGDERAHGDAVVNVFGMDEVGAVHDEDDGVQLLDGGGEAGDEVADVARFDAGGGGFCGVGVPAALRPAEGVVYFQGFHAFNGFYRKPLSLRGFAHGFVDGTRQRELREDAGDDDHRDDGQRHHRQLSGDHVHHGDEQQEERHIDEGEQAGAGHEVAHRFKVAQVVGVGTGGGGFVRHAQLHHAAEERGGDDEVGFFPGDVGQVAADEFGEKFKEDGKRDADT